MKFGVSQKNRLLFRLVLNIVVVITIITFFFLSSETDRFKIFIRGVMLFIFLGFSISSGIHYIKELRKTDQ